MLVDSRINFIIGTGSEELVLRRKIEVYCARYAELEITFTEHPLPTQKTSLYIIHVFHLRDFLRGPQELPVPVISYGPPSSLTDAWHSGAVDYIKDPWNASELHFRIHRALSGTDHGFAWHGLAAEVDSITCGTCSLQISYQEFRILKLLAEYEGTAVPRESLYYTIWGRPGPQSRVVDVYVSRLRKKLRSLLNGNDNGSRATISTVRGEGYLLSWRGVDMLWIKK